MLWLFCVSAYFCVTGRVSLGSISAFTAFTGLISQAYQVSSISFTGGQSSSDRHTRPLYLFNRETGLFGRAYLGVGAALYDLSPVEHDDVVGADDGGEAVRHNDG